jgi:hypothetical protein
MNWRQTLSICFIPLIIIMVVLVKGQDEEIIPVNNQHRKIASSHNPRLFPRHRKNVPARSISALRNGKITHQFFKDRIPASLEQSFEKNNGVNVSRGYEFLTDVAAIPKDNFNPALGTIIHKDENFVFFRANPGHSYVPVAISKSTKMLYPISSVVHIRGATQDMRNQLIGQGYQQYYYQPALKFLSIQSKSGEVLKLYNELSEKGLNVQLEVLKPHHQSI